MSFFANSLKILRQSAGLTMQELAEKSGVSKSMICKIERIDVQPTLDVAARLAKALGKTLSEMLHPTQTTDVIFLSKNDQACWIDASQIKRHNISPVFEGLKVEWLEIEMPQGTIIDKPLPLNEKNAEKYILVTEGKLEVTVNEQNFLLTEGDSIYFNASVSHRFINCGQDLAKYYIVIKYD